MSGLGIDVDIERLWAELIELASHSDAPAPAVTRVVYSGADVAARAMVKKLFREAGLAVREDALGNTFARWEGQRGDLAAVATGSHIDAIPYSGRFDGTVGVLGAIEAVRRLSVRGSGRCVRLRSFYSRVKSRRDLASAAWAAGPCAEAFRRRRWRHSRIPRATPLTSSRGGGFSW